MRFINGPIPPSRTLDPESAGWTPLDSSGSRRFAVTAMVCTLPVVSAAAWLFLHAAPELRALFHRHFWSLPSFVLLLLALVPVHEAIHALAYGCGLRSPNLIIGVWLQRGLPYVLCDEPLPRGRVLWMIAAPFCALTVLPLLAAPLFSGAALTCIVFFSVLHAALCVGDAATFARLFQQVPTSALIHNQGWRTYWCATEPQQHRKTRTMVDAR